MSEKRRQALKISKNKQISVGCVTGSFTDCSSAEVIVSYLLEPSLNYTKQTRESQP